MTTTIISSQRYLNEDIVNNYKQTLCGDSALELRVYDIAGTDYAILVDGHHRRAAALELGIRISYCIIDHPEGLTGDDLLEQTFNDSPYYDIETGKDVF